MKERIVKVYHYFALKVKLCYKRPTGHLYFSGLSGIQLDAFSSNSVFYALMS